MDSLSGQGIELRISPIDMKEVADAQRTHFVEETMRYCAGHTGAIVMLHTCPDRAHLEV